VDLINHYGDGVPNGETISGDVQHIVLTFDENMLAVDPDLDPNSILNPHSQVPIDREEVSIEWFCRPHWDQQWQFLTTCQFQNPHFQTTAADP
jgi:hypothetical protein